ncbi:MAG: ATP-binding protein [Negativicutes bacterium]|nr:ATP-binding protein [Negativicutes bacterium]
MKLFQSRWGINISMRSSQQGKGSKGWLATVKPIYASLWPIAALTVCLLGGLWWFIQANIDYEYKRAIADTSKDTMNLARAYEEHVRRMIQQADMDLIDLRTIYQREGLSSPAIISHLPRMGNDPARSQVSIGDEQGIIITSLKEPVFNSFLDRDYFQYHRSATEDTLFIGESTQSRISGRSIIPLTRRIEKPDGSFGGIVYISLEADYFHNYYSKLDLGKNQLLTLAGMDGFNRVSRVDDYWSNGEDIRGGHIWKEIQAGHTSGSFTGPNLDGIVRIASYRVMPDYPLIVIVGMSKDSALAGFETRRDSYIIGGALSALFVVIVGLLLMNRVIGQKRVTAEMTRLDRLNLVGEIAASIGHEIRNPLTTVRGYLQLYGRKNEYSHHTKQFTLMIEELDRANSIITEFLSLAKNKTAKLTLTNLNTVIENIYPLLQADALRRGVNIDLELQEIPAVLADEKEILQCILNLVNNAMDVSPKGGSVTIGTAAGRNRVVLTVRDYGPGMPPEIVSKLGTPFFTTKDNGVGLGIAVCHRVAQRHNAILEVETSPEGTAIHVIFRQ